MSFIPVMAKLVLKKHFWMLKTEFVLLNVFVETVKHFFQDSLMNSKFKSFHFLNGNLL